MKHRLRSAAGRLPWLMAALAASGLAGQRCLCIDSNGDGSYAICGNGVAAPQEDCDGDDLKGETCESLGFASGVLGCGFCSYDTRDCVPPRCGDGERNAPGELCDRRDGVQETCESLGFRGGGYLACNDTCDGYDTSWCDPGDPCGNGYRDPGEVCDGLDLGEVTCETFGYRSGTPTCWDCESIAETGCLDPMVCGDGIADPGEGCDGYDLRGAVCADVGFTGGGALACTSTCVPDVRGCLGGCGNGRLEGDEVCDGADLGGHRCADLGYPAGGLVCQRDCLGFHVEGCGTWDATCGDGVREAGEQCDPEPGWTCQSLGFSGGTLGCDATCRIDPRSCAGDACAASGQYGDGWCDACERLGGAPDPDCTALCPLADGACVSYRDPLLGVSTCRLATGAEDPDCGPCGDGLLDPEVELCDGDDFAVDCADYGYAPSRPAGCDAACVPDLSSCAPHRCGDGILCPGCGEQCDDGNLEPGDGCDGECHREGILEVEPNEDRSAAQDLGSASGSPTWVIGAIAPSGDVDHFRVRLDAAGSLRVSVTGAHPSWCLDGTANPEVRITRGSSITIVGWNDDRDPGTDSCAEVEVNDLDVGDYVIRVAASPFADPAMTFAYLMSVSRWY